MRCPVRNKCEHAKKGKCAQTGNCPIKFHCVATLHYRKNFISNKGLAKRMSPTLIINSAKMRKKSKWQKITLSGKKSI